MLDLSGGRFWLVLGLAPITLIWWFGIKRSVLGLANLYKAGVKFYLSLWGETFEDVAARRVVSGTTWDEFCDSLKAAGAVVMSKGTPKDPFNQAEGYRYLSRLVRGGLENFIENADPRAPRFTSIANGLRAAPVKLGADNPDNLYENATIDGRLTYRIWGHRGTVDMLGFGVQAGQYGKPGGLKTVAYKEVDDLTINPDGSFEIFVGPEKPAGAINYLQSVTEPPQGMIIVRQTFGDRRKEAAATMQIEVHGQKNVPTPLTCSALDEGLNSTALFVGGASMMFARWADGFQKHANQLPLFDQKLSDSVGGNPNIRYYHSYWAIDADEALVIEAKPPPCRTWNFQLNNYWTESLDYRYFDVHTNKFIATYDDKDNSVCIVVADRPPQMSRPHNYLTTDGHRCGTMCFRWCMPEVSDEDLPHPKIKVVKLTELEQ